MKIMSHREMAAKIRARGQVDVVPESGVEAFSSRDDDEETPTDAQRVINVEGGAGGDKRR